MHRADPGRTSYRRVDLAFPLTPLWQHQAAAPQPAWGPPARRSYWQRLEHLEARVTDDHVMPAVIAGESVLYGSPTEDRVQCLDASSGRVRWTYWTDGPVRQAPVVDGERSRVFFGSDDGWVYAVDLRDGRLVWRHAGVPTAGWIPGNGRWISRAPVRSGLLVDGGVVFGTAGLFPEQGVVAFALDAATGTARWERSLDLSPEGPILAAGSLILIPTGRASPVGLDRGSGATVRTFDTGGGTYAVVRGTELFGGPGNTGTLTGVSARSGQRLVTVPGRNLVAAGDRLFLLDAGELKAVDRARQAMLEAQLREVEARLRARQKSQAGAAAPSPGAPRNTGNGLDPLRQEAEVLRDQIAACVLWRVACPENLALIGTGDAVVAGGEGRVAAFDPRDGRRLWDAAVTGRALALAASGGRLVVATDRGSLEAFGPGNPQRGSPKVGEQVEAEVGADPHIDTGSSKPDAVLAGWLDRLRRAGLPDRGWVLVTGIGSGRLVEALLAETALGLVLIDPDPAKVDRWRKRLVGSGRYGVRASVHTLPAGRLPFTDAAANAVISESGLEDGSGGPYPIEELDRLVRPYGGVRWTDAGKEPVRRGALEGAGEWTHQFGNPSNTANSGDRRVHAGLRLQWFGGPGPDPMVDRHLRAPAPLCAGGRLFVPGEDQILAVDAYNGTLLWQRDLPGSQRYSMPYDAGYQSVDGERLAVAVRDSCWILRASDGEVVRRWRVPDPPPHGGGEDPAGVEWHWGYTVLSGDGLFGSAQRSTASRTTPGYDQIAADYGNDQPLVTGVSVFRLEAGSGRVVWQRPGGVVLNTTLTLHADRLLYVEARAPGLRTHPTGRMPLSTLLEGDPWLVALDAATGEPRWEQRLEGEILSSRSVLYLLGAGNRLVLVGSRLGDARDTRYLVECRGLEDGKRLWEGGHGAGKPGEFSHGEQVHHPVVLDDLLVAEPVTYDLVTGRPVAGPSGEDVWQLVRPGHSCGTLSGAADCLFFRANNPTVLDLRASLRSASVLPRKLAPSRTGCWINMIPAAGLLLVPEASAGCICQYSLQTSMGFLPGPR